MEVAVTVLTVVTDSTDIYIFTYLLIYQSLEFTLINITDIFIFLLIVIEINVLLEY